MKAKSPDYETFRAWLQNVARFGNGQTSEEANYAALILDKFDSAKIGYIGRKCCCGNTGVSVRNVQPVPQWPNESYVFCVDHAQLIDDYNKLLQMIVQSEKVNG